MPWVASQMNARDSPGPNAVELPTTTEPSAETDNATFWAMMPESKPRLIVPVSSLQRKASRPLPLDPNVFSENPTTTEPSADAAYAIDPRDVPVLSSGNGCQPSAEVQRAIRLGPGPPIGSPPSVPT